MGEVHQRGSGADRGGAGEKGVSAQHDRRNPEGPVRGTFGQTGHREEALQDIGREELNPTDPRGPVQPHEEGGQREKTPDGAPQGQDREERAGRNRVENKEVSEVLQEDRKAPSGLEVRPGDGEAVGKRIELKAVHGFSSPLREDLSHPLVNPYRFGHSNPDLFTVYHCELPLQS